MASKRFSDEELRRQLVNRATRVARFVQSRSPASIINHEVGMVVASAKLLGSPEQVDEMVAYHWAIADSMENGVCWMCRAASAAKDDYICEACAAKVAAGAREVEGLLGKKTPGEP